MERAVRRRANQPDVVSSEERLTVTTSYGGKESNRVEKLSVRKFLSEPAYVRVNAGMTINKGNYESLRLDVSISMPCYTEEIDKVLPLTADKVAAFLEEETEKYE